MKTLSHLQIIQQEQKVQEKHTEGCVVCGQELVYAETSIMQTCIYCGREQESSIHCPAGHFVCDRCHRSDALGMIEVITANSKTTNPLEMAREIMSLPSVNMHGPEHHSLVPAVLVAAVRNLSREDVSSRPLPENGRQSPDLDRRIRETLLRSSQLPGGICGMWGTCGAAIGAGIGLSVLRKLTALTKQGWGETNREVGEILQRVGAYGGPRCCKRSTYSALLAAVEILERDGTAKFPEEAHKLPVCKDFRRNQQCLKEQCPYYPKPKLQIDNNATTGEK